MRCHRSAVTRFPRREPGGAGQIRQTRTSDEVSLVGRSMETLDAALRDSRARTLDLVLDLDDARWMGPRLAIVNPIRWEIGHVAWFQEHWVLRHARGAAPLLPGGDALYDSARVPHDDRWVLLLPSRAETLRYMEAVLE